MLFTHLTGILAAICGLITPTSARGLNQNDLVERAAADDVGALHWFGEVTPGEGPITVIGNDMEDIINQINIMNPDYMTTEPTNTYDIFQHIQTMYCGIFATANGNAIFKLVHPYNRTVWADWKRTEPGKCERHACMDTSAIYVCNDNPHPFIIMGWDMFQWAGAIVNSCCGALWNNPANSGQAFSKQGFNIVVAYGNCNHEPTDIDRPSDFEVPGVNGRCCDFCRFDKNGHRYPGGWGHDGL